MKIYGMKHIICLLLGISLSAMAMAQTDSTALYYQFSKVPAFTITTVPDSSKYTNADLVKKKPSLVIFFSPDCEHCQKETQKMLKNMDLLKKSQILMVSAMEYHFNKQFYEDYKLGNYSNITVGREPTLSMGMYYKVHSLPSVYVYDAKGNFLKLIKSTIPVEEIAKLLNL